MSEQPVIDIIEGFRITRHSANSNRYCIIDPDLPWTTGHYVDIIGVSRIGRNVDSYVMHDDETINKHSFEELDSIATYLDRMKEFVENPKNLWYQGNSYGVANSPILGECNENHDS